jgi:anti-sigma-K factor RskA
LLHVGTPAGQALTSGFRRALLAASIALIAAAIVALRTSNARSTTPIDVAEQPVSEPAIAA